MKPAPFAYVRPESLEDAIGVLDEHGEDARVLAGGQSLMATLNMRLSAPGCWSISAACRALRASRRPATGFGSAP